MPIYLPWFFWFTLPCAGYSVKLKKIYPSRGARAQVCDCKCDRLSVRLPLEVLKYLIFLFLHSGVEAKRGYKFRHSMPLEFGEKFGAECLNTKLSVPVLLHAAAAALS